MSSSEKSDVNKSGCPHLSFVINDASISSFLLLLQRGFLIKAHVGCSVYQFLREEIGVSPDTIENIQSIFLDGRPVDDLESAMIKDGSILALSAAMPGLVGATLRRGGAYSSFRNTITYRETDVQCISGEGFVRVKLFNLLMNQLGPGFLTKGIFVKSSDLMSLLTGQSQVFWQGCRQVLLDGKPVEPRTLRNNERFSRYEQVFLSVTTLKGDA